ncbi:MAG: protein-L-isoaspartate(D-aspartate) O-methyltransferase [Bacteroidales bacterium]|nr:protein-L-isoaspartate(D-aspartate) O-methyltransferase [Bacteroidales bacterium]
MIEDTFRHKGLRERLCEELRAKGITDNAVLEAVKKVPRHFFIDSSMDSLAYEDRALPIACGQTISHPHTVAFQTQLLGVKRNDKILEIGTGSGYQACILAAMGARVLTIERHNELYLRAQQPIAQLKYFVRTFLGDGYMGLPTAAPFDKILITCGAPIIPPALLAQLKTGGVMVIPVGNDDYEMRRITKISDSEIKEEAFGNFSFVPMLEKVQGVKNSFL